MCLLLTPSSLVETAFRLRGPTFETPENPFKNAILLVWKADLSKKEKNKNTLKRLPFQVIDARINRGSLVTTGKIIDNFSPTLRSPAYCYFAMILSWSR